MDSRYDEQLGGYVPSIPLPFYEWSWLGLRKRYGCWCGKKFTTERLYQIHYALNHLEPMEEAENA